MNTKNDLKGCLICKKELKIMLGLSYRKLKIDKRFKISVTVSQFKKKENWYFWVAKFEKNKTKYLFKGSVIQ